MTMNYKSVQSARIITVGTAIRTSVNVKIRERWCEVIPREYTKYVCFGSLHKEYVEFELHWSSREKLDECGMPCCPVCGWSDDVEDWSEQEEKRKEERREREENEAIAREEKREELKRHNCKKEDSWWEYDAQNIPLCRVCSICQKAKLSQYRPEILTGYDQSDVCEPIEPDLYY
jgi:hypothetical protein